MPSEDVISTPAMKYGLLRRLSDEQVRTCGLEFLGVVGDRYCYIRYFKTNDDVRKFGEGLIEVDHSGKGNYKIKPPPQGV